MQVVLSETQANLLAEKLMDLGNLSVAGLFLDQLIGKDSFNPGVAMLGAISLVATYSMAYYLMQGGTLWRK